MNPVVHFEMPLTDSKRMSKFYTDVFGWKMQDMGPQMGSYVLAHTTETDAKGMIKTPGHINGGFFPKTAETGDKPMLVIAVPDIQAHMKKVKAAGGKVLGEPIDIPTVGKYVSFIDTEGNKVNMLQPVMGGKH